MSKVKVDAVHVPTVKTTRISAADLHEIMSARWQWKKLKLTDHWYYVPSFEDWDTVFQHLLARIPKYVPDKFDCENFAGFLRVMACKEFGINTCGDAEGNADLGRGYLQRHGWTVFPSLEDGGHLFQLESQRKTGYFFKDIDDPTYVPDEIVIG